MGVNRHKITEYNAPTNGYKLLTYVVYVCYCLVKLWPRPGTYLRNRILMFPSHILILLHRAWTQVSQNTAIIDLHE